MALQPDASAGVNTGSKLFILFLLIFLLINYSVFLSISLGAIAGLTGGFTAAWWNAKEDYLSDAEAEKLAEGEESTEGGTTPASSSRRRYGFGVVPAHQARRRRQRSGNWKIFSWMPRRKK